MKKKIDKLFIILSTGKEDQGLKATLAFTLALSALAFGHPVTVFLTGEGVVWADTDETKKANIPNFPVLSALINDFIAQKGELLLCSTCSVTFGKGKPKPAEAQMCGFAAIVPHVMDPLSRCLTF